MLTKINYYCCIVPWSTKDCVGSTINTAAARVVAPDTSLEFDVVNSRGAAVIGGVLDASCSLASPQACRK